MRGFAVAFLLASMLLLGGCVYSETITEIIVNNAETSQIDPNITPVLVNTPTATETTDDMPRLEDDDSASAAQTEAVKPYYTSDESKATTDALAPRPVYAKNVDKAGEAAVQACNEVESDTTQDSDPTEENQPEDGAQPEPSDQGSEDSDTHSEQEAESSKGNGDKDEGEGADDEVGGGEGGGGDPGEEPGEATGQGMVYTSDVDQEPELPEGVDEVAAVGNYAVIVSMLSGTAEGSSLVACDEATKNQTSSVLANRGMASVPALWNGDGESAGDLGQEAFDQLVTEAKPDLVFVAENSATVTEAQVQALQDAGVDVYYLPKLTSAKRIRFAVRVIGMILAKGGVAAAEPAYSSYLDFEDALVAKYLDSGHNGGVTGGYDMNLERESQAANSTVVTLFIDKWDIDARHAESLVDTSNGVAVATLGYASAPVSHYLSVGGVLNNASSRLFRLLSGSGVVWQFAQNEFGYRFGSWSSLDIATYDLCSQVSGGIYISDLLWNTYEINAGYGTEAFPAIVVKSNQLKKRMNANAKREGQLYYPYPLIHPAGGNGTTLGFFRTATGEGSYVESCIGRTSDDGRLEPASPQNCQLFVNPKGLSQGDADDDLCSWTDGSPESMLEASWAYWKFRGGSEAEFRQDVADFYSTFYGYDVTASDFDIIIGGPVS
ncbi:MAG: hypothetical protein IJ087_08345 [Eggerthellaceae bacterium]|nr:hypothetical protein [Eggerthellaceae bacterium]